MNISTESGGIIISENDVFVTENNSGKVAHDDALAAEAGGYS